MVTWPFDVIRIPSLLYYSYLYYSDHAPQEKSTPPSQGRDATVHPGGAHSHQYLSRPGGWDTDLTQFQNLNAQVLGISVDSTWAHKAFAEKLGLQFPLLADFNPKGAVADKYGLYLADRGIAARAVVVIDKEGVVRFVKQYDIPTVPDTKEVVAAVQALK